MDSIDLEGRMLPLEGWPRSASLTPKRVKILRPGEGSRFPPKTESGTDPRGLLFS